MMQHFHSEPEPHSVYAAPGASQYAALPPQLDAAEQQRLQESIEDYLDRVCRPLVDALPYAARQELRREIAQHLNALVQAYRESGYAPALATEKALEKFGPPHLVAQKWNPVTAREGLPRRMERWFAGQWQGMAVMLVLCGAAGACGLLLRHAALSSLPVVSHLQPTVSGVATLRALHALRIATTIDERVTLTTELAARLAALNQARAELMSAQSHLTVQQGALQVQELAAAQARTSVRSAQDALRLQRSILVQQNAVLQQRMQVEQMQIVLQERQAELQQATAQLELIRSQEAHSRL